MAISLAAWVLFSVGSGFALTPSFPSFAAVQRAGLFLSTPGTW
jgi:hypothetical protein